LLSSELEEMKKKNSFQITTEKLTLTKLTIDYISEKYVNWLNDKDVMKYSEQRHIVHTKESCRDYICSLNNTNNLAWAILIKENNIHIGNIQVIVDTYNHVADISILIGEKNYMNHGYGSEAFLGVVNYLFVFKGMRKVTAGTMSLNKGMLKIMKNASMLDDGVFKDHFIFNGQFADLIHKALFSKE
jgi:RimJ/RimL family protein N-acetyltransferase